MFRVISFPNDTYIYTNVSFASHILFLFYDTHFASKVCFIIMFECTRAGVVVMQTNAGRAAIQPSQFGFAVFGPIICGAIGGSGSGFMPLSKGLEPLKDGMTPPMLTALLGAAGYHLFLSTSLSEGIIDAPKKAHFHMVIFFIVVGLSTAFGVVTPGKVVKSVKKNK
jgi:hypothetical protein